MHDEELGRCGIGIHRSGHRQDASGVLELVDDAVGKEFAFDGLFRSAHAGACRVAALDHEAFDDPVENNTVKELFFDERYEVFDRDRCRFGIKLSFDLSAVFHSDSDINVFHVS